MHAAASNAQSAGLRRLVQYTLKSQLSAFHFDVENVPARSEGTHTGASAAVQSALLSHARYSVGEELTRNSN